MNTKEIIEFPNLKNNKMKTAMQTAIDKLAEFWETEQDFGMAEYIHINEILVSLLDLEKQQIIDAYIVANGELIEHSIPRAEQYYNETFK